MYGYVECLALMDIRMIVLSIVLNNSQLLYIDYQGYKFIGRKIWK